MMKRIFLSRTWIRVLIFSVLILLFVILRLPSLESAATLNYALLLNLHGTQDSTLYEKAQGLKVNNWRAVYYNGWQAFQRGDYPKSINFLSHAFFATGSTRPLIGLYLGLAYDAIGDRNGAIRIWAEAHDEDFFTGRGRQKFLARQILEALADYQLALQINPSSVLARLEMGNCFLELGDYRSALRVFMEANSLAPRNIDVHQGIVSSYFGMKEITQAAEWDVRTAELVTPIEAHVFRGRAKLWIGEYAASIKELSDYVLSVKTNWYAFGLLCLAYRSNGQLTEAVDACNQKIAHSPTPLASNYAELGDIYAQAGDANSARTAYVRALEIDPRNDSALKGLGLHP